MTKVKKTEFFKTILIEIEKIRGFGLENLLS